MDLISHKTNNTIVDNFCVKKKTIHAHHKLVEKNHFWSVFQKVNGLLLNDSWKKPNLKID